jgi:hypothetical protein
MGQGLSQKEAVWMAKETLGEASSADLAAYIQEAFGLAIKPPIVTVVLGSIQERAALDRTGQATYAKIDQWKVENPEEAKRMAAVTKRREAAKRRKAELAAAKASEAPGDDTADCAAAGSASGTAGEGDVGAAEA